MWIPNTFLRHRKDQKEDRRGKREEGRRAILPSSVFLLPSLFVVAFALASCGPKYSYPAAEVPQSIERICKEEYKLDVKARVSGKTAGALFVLDSLLDEKEQQISKDVYEQMSKVMMVITRVALSSDLPLDFCKVVIRDRARTGELIVVRSIDDARRAQAEAIGIEESMNRTLFSQEKPQGGEDGLEDFVLKEVKLEDFLADQIAQRLRFEVMKGAQAEIAASSGQPLVLVDGSFDTAYGKRTFRFSILSLKADRSYDLMQKVLKTATGVLRGYKFTAYDDLEIQDYLNRRRLVVERDVVEQYLDKKIKEDEIFEQYVTEAPAIHEAFKLFGIDLQTGDAESSPEDPDSSDSGSEPSVV